MSLPAYRVPLRGSNVHLRRGGPRVSRLCQPLPQLGDNLVCLVVVDGEQQPNPHHDDGAADACGQDEALLGR